MSSLYGKSLSFSVFGESHGAAIGMVLDGIPAGLRVNDTELKAFLARRAPGNNPWSTPRKEADEPQFLSGVLNGFTTGSPICAVIFNQNTRSGDYENLKNTPRPGHADYTAQIKYSGYQNAAGGGHFSGRLSAPICIAGGLCKQWLAQKGIQIGAHILRIGQIYDDAFNPISPEIDKICEPFPVISENSGDAMKHAVCQAKQSLDSIGGQIECAVTGLPAGLGEPMFGGVESTLSQILFAIPALKEVKFGDTQDLGSQNNDPFAFSDGRVITTTNHAGGVLGGITNGMPLLFTVTIKPTPSIAAQQKTVDLDKKCPASVTVQGRHDPCIVPRAVPVVEAAAAIALFDLILGNTQRGI